jgi:peptidylprolyl isomerase
MRSGLAVLVTATLVLAACGSDDTDDATADTVADDATADTVADDTRDAAANGGGKPSVEIPDEVPTELVRTVLVEGEGPPAEDGDQVIVDYVGVRSVDGVEFDNSYDRGEPFGVTLGQPGVIQGWLDGLAGARTGDRIQLDIPSELAYGSTARDDVIREDEALTFVIDVRAVVPPPDPAEAPDEPGVELSEGAVETSTVDLVDGEGAELSEADTAVIRYVMFRGDNGTAIETNWTAPPLQLQIGDPQLLPGLAEGLPGMQVGGRRAITIPPEDGFGAEGNPQGGLPADTDIIVVVDLLAAF